MSFFHYIRFSVFDRAQYTVSESREMRLLHALYLQHLNSIQPIESTQLALRDSESFVYPKHLGVDSVEGASLGAERNTQPLVSFAESIVSSLRIYHYRRSRRFYRSGYPNDPTNLLCGQLIRFVSDRLLLASCNEETLSYVTKLRQFLMGVRTGGIFQNEPEGDGSMDVLLHNLIKKLDRVREKISDEMALSVARNHFQRVRQIAARALDYAAQYLFYVVPDRELSDVEFSIVGHHTTIDGRLKEVLATREGALLKNLINHPCVKSVALPIKRHQALAAPYCGGEVVLFKDNGFFDEHGSVNESWVSALGGDNGKLSEEDREIPSFMCRAVKSKSEITRQLVKLHGLFVSFAEYYSYTTEFWKLAGFGGDHLIYHLLAKIVTCMMSEFSEFNAALIEEIAAAQHELEALFNDAVVNNAMPNWRSNYLKAKQKQESLSHLLAECNSAIGEIVKSTRDIAIKEKGLQSARQSYSKISRASEFLNKVRSQRGLEKKSYAFEAVIPQRPEGILSQLAPEMVQEPMAMEDVMLTLTDHDSSMASELIYYYEMRPVKRPPWFLVGASSRYSYLQDCDRLSELGATLSEIKASKDKKEDKASYVKGLLSVKKRAKEELARIDEVDQRLWWPFHRYSQQFFGLWRKSFLHAISYVDKSINGMFLVPSNRIEREGESHNDRFAFFDSNLCGIEKIPLPSSEELSQRFEQQSQLLEELHSIANGSR